MSPCAQHFAAAGVVEPMHDAVRTTMKSRAVAAPLALVLALLAGCIPPAEAPAPVTLPPSAAPAVVGGATMQPNHNIVQNLQNSRDHTTLVAGVQAAGLVATLSGTGPYTLFAPNNAAFASLPNGTVEALMQTRSRPELAKLLNYHIVAGAKTRAQIGADARNGGGTATYRTLQGGTIRIGGSTITDANGRRSSVTQADVRHSNGVMHVVDTVLLPTP